MAHIKVIELTEELCKEAQELLQSPLGCSVIILDLRRLRYISSSTLLLMLELRKLVQADNGAIILCSLNRNTVEMIRDTRIDTIFQIYANRHDALENYAA